MVVAAHAQLVDCVGVREADQLYLVQHHQERVQDAVLRCDDPALFKAVPVNHITMESVLAVDKDLVFVLRVEPPSVQLLKLVKQCLVRLEHNELVVNVRWHCDPNIAEVVAWVEKEAVSSEVSQEISIQFIVLQLNALGGLTEGFFSLGPFERVG